MRLRRWRHTPTLALAAIILSGCSWAFVQAPPPGHQTMSYFDCTSSNALPTLDLIIGTVGLLEGISFTTDGNGASTVSQNKNAIVVAAAQTALFAVSSYYGYRTTATCREAKEDLVRRYPVHPVPLLPALRAPYDPWLTPRPAPPAAWEVPGAAPDAGAPASGPAGPDGGGDGAAPDETYQPDAAAPPDAASLPSDRPGCCDAASEH